MASVLLKRGRMILKKRYDSRKHALRNNLFKTTMSGWDSHKARLENINTANQNEFGLSNNNLAITAGAPALKEAIKLEDKLISGEEIEFCPAYRIESQHTECVTDEAVLGECLTNESSRQSKISKNESSKFYLNNFESDKIHNSSDKSPIFMDDYPKLYVSVMDTSDKNAMAKSSLLKNIRSIQNTNEDSYGINISNSRFFVPKDYIFSGVESAMNDLKFEVDPEMGRLLQRSYSNLQVSTSLPTLVNIEANSSLDNTTITAETLSVPSDSTKQRADPDFRNIKALSDSMCLTLKESDKAEQRQKLFLKRRESKPSCEIIDFILNETTSKSKTIAESQIRNHAESSDELDNRRSIYENEKKSQETRYQKDHEFSLLEASCLKDETTEKETPHNNKELWIAKHMIDNDQTTKPLCLDVIPEDRKVFDTLEESKISNSSDESDEIRSQRLTKSINTECEKIKSSRNILSAPLMRRKSYPLLTPSEIAYRSKYHLSIPVVSLNTSGILGSHSEILESISESSINQKKQIGSLVCNEQLQEPKCSSSNETNRINRMRFPQGIHDYQIEKATSSESKLPTTSEEPKVSQNNMDLGSKQPSLMGRTSSLREKFETIVEDVELRTLSGRRPRISESCGRKSLS